MKNVTQYKNIIYRARVCGLNVNTRKRTIFISNEDCKSRKFERYIKILQGIGFAVQITELVANAPRILVYQHGNTDECTLRRAMSEMKGASTHISYVTPGDIRQAVSKLTTCQKLCLFTGWYDSEETMALYVIAKKLGMEVLFYT